MEREIKEAALKKTMKKNTSFNANSKKSLKEGVEKSPLKKTMKKSSSFNAKQGRKAEVSETLTKLEKRARWMSE